MSLLEDIYVEDVDMEGDLERIVENDDVEPADRNSEEENDGNSHSEAEEVAPKKVNPEAEKKAKVVKNPRYVLNPARLMGPRGITTIEGFFKDFKFRGKGYEKEDLDVVMKKLEHWAHRLYPKFQFDDCLDKIASLGNKKIVQVHMRKIRLDMIHDDDGIVRQDDDSDDENQPAATNAPVMDEFDMLLEQQIALARSTPATNSKNNTFNINSSFANISAVEPHKINTPQQITDEQKARMMKNRLLAEERRLARMKLNVAKTTETHNIEDSSKKLTEDTVNRQSQEDTVIRQSQENTVNRQIQEDNMNSSVNSVVDSQNKINTPNHEDAVNEGSKESDVVEKNDGKVGNSDDEMMDIDSLLLDSNNV